MRSLPALARELRAGDEVIVVDNASGRRFEGGRGGALSRGARIIDAGGNTGFAAGANPGAAAASGELLVFLNPDVTVAARLRRGDPRGRSSTSAAGMHGWGSSPPSDGAGINTSGNVVHFTGIAWAGQAGRPLGRRAGRAARGRVPVGRVHGRPARGLAAPRRLSRSATSCTTRTSTSRCGCGSQVAAIGIEPAARVDHDYEFDKGPAKWRYMERNRLSMIVRVYPGALLLLVLPALLATEVALLLVSVAGGWGRQKLLADAQWLRALPRLLVRAPCDTRASARSAPRSSRAG